ncbi:MAG: SagB/ThcOx family dehydrogenase [Terriglobia bacterium]|jgi:SagB-type dehydrogenase family enzyme
MNNKSCTLSVLLAFFLLSSVAAAQELKPVSLPDPQTDGGKPLMQALKARSTSREIKPDRLPLQVLSNLLWAAFGINRPESGKRTAPSAMNWQEIDIYVAMADGLYVYDAKAKRLNPVLATDVRGATGTQDFVKDAPVNLVYVADLARTGDASADAQNLYTTVDTGVIVQNVYLFCASEGLGTVVRGSVDRAALSKVMKLRPNQHIIVAQSVGYPKK